MPHLGVAPVELADVSGNRPAGRDVTLGAQLALLCAPPLVAAAALGSVPMLVAAGAAVAIAAVVYRHLVTVRNETEERLSHLAVHDALTGLPNRALLADRLSLALQRRERTRTPVAVLFIDVDHFKRINDSRGHATGDTVLVGLAQRMLDEVRPGDTVARFGGDEFVVFCDDVGTELEAMELATRLQVAARVPFPADDGDVRVTVSIGVVLADDGAGADELVRRADAAMYRAKERQRGTIEVFNDALKRRAHDRAQTESALRRALAGGELVVRYQPEISLLTGHMVGVEALARWNHPTRGLLGPGEFIPVAEDSGLIAELGRFVLDEACRQLAAWRAQGLDGLTMAVNVSARQLTNAAFPAAVRATLADTAVPADRLHLEITEAAVADGDSRVAHVLDELRHMGVHLTLDNFGTGSSSLGLLRRLPVDAVKVDRSFVAELSHLPEDASTVAAVLGMARGLGLATFGEGVEQEGQLDELGRLGCEFAQGYLLSRPGEAELIPALAGLDLRSAEVRPRT